MKNVEDNFQENYMNESSSVYVLDKVFLTNFYFFVYICGQ